MGSSKGVMDAPWDLRGASRAHLMLGNSITDVVHKHNQLYIRNIERNTVMAAKYDGSEIVVLKGLEAVRKRPGMYIGSTGSRGLHHLIWEILDNGIDEHLAGFCNEIEITMLKDGGIQITDHGRGVPVDIHPTEHIPTVRVVYTILHAGGKFGNSV